MLLTEMRERFAVVLVGARNPSNIGAAARAMQDFGFSDLRYVNDYAAPFEAAQLEATKSAVGAAEVMRRARAFASVREAVADCSLVVGTTAIGARQMDREVVRLREAVAPVREELINPRGRVGLLFGSEKTGLTNEQLSYCQRLMTIPMYAPVGERHLSMNLGQSVAVCLYELTREGFEGSRELPESAEELVTADARERLRELLSRSMDATGYARRFPANARETVVRSLAAQLGNRLEDAATWMGFLRQILRRSDAEAASETQNLSVTEKDGG